MKDTKDISSQLSAEEQTCLNKTIIELRELTNKYTRTTEGDLGFRSDAIEATNSLLAQVAFEKYQECKAANTPKKIIGR